MEDEADAGEAKGIHGGRRLQDRLPEGEEVLGLQAQLQGLAAAEDGSRGRQADHLRAPLTAQLPAAGEGIVEDGQVGRREHDVVTELVPEDDPPDLLLEAHEDRVGAGGHVEGDERPQRVRALPGRAQQHVAGTTQGREVRRHARTPVVPQFG